jgi:hypothetical protein
MLIKKVLEKKVIIEKDMKWLGLKIRQLFLKIVFGMVHG